MRLTLTPLIVTLAAGAVSASLVGLGTWDAAKAGLLTALSVIAAAALVRLARGLPFNNPDHFEPDEVEQVTEAVKQLARSLRAFLGIVLATMVLLVVLGPLSKVIDRLWLIDHARMMFKDGVSFAVGASLAYVLTRLWQIVGSDLSLLDLQAKFMIRAVHRKARDKDELRAKVGEAAPFSTPEGYGQRLQ